MTAANTDTYGDEDDFDLDDDSAAARQARHYSDLTSVDRHIAQTAADRAGIAANAAHRSAMSALDSAWTRATSTRNINYFVLGLVLGIVFGLALAVLGYTAVQRQIDHRIQSEALVSVSDRADHRFSARLA